MTLKKEWDNFESVKKFVLSSFRSWEKRNIHVTHGKIENDIELTYGFPYTSCGDYAALWNTNCQAEYVFDRQYHFVGLACTEYGQAIAILEDSKEKAIYIEL